MLKPEPAEHSLETVSMDVLTLPTADTEHIAVLSIVDHHSLISDTCPSYISFYTGSHKDFS